MIVYYLYVDKINVIIIQSCKKTLFSIYSLKCNNILYCYFYLLENTYPDYFQLIKHCKTYQISNFMTDIYYVTRGMPDKPT